MHTMLNQLRPAIVCFAALTVITGIIYPAFVTAVAQVAFPDAANGSVITRDGHPVGSALIAQSFTSDTYFLPRPSAANYAADAGSGSNLGPTNPALVTAVNERVQAAGRSSAGMVPVDLVTTSASGLDPHISPSAAEHQVARIARARSISEADVRRLVTAHTEGRTLGLLGEPRVNVLELNLALDHPEASAATSTSALPQALGWRWRGFAPDVH